MIFLIYNILLTFSLLLAAPYFLGKTLFRKQLRKSLLQRMGFFKSSSLEKAIWVHAASVGEVRCSIPLVRKIKKEFPHFKIILTTMTSTGNETAKTYLPEADQILFMPVDHPLVIRRSLEKIQPGLLLIAETELWPNLLRTCGKKGIPVILFNGRISQKSFRRYFFFRFFFKQCLKYISCFLMQTEEDRTRIIEMGGESRKAKAVGNLKFDQTLPSFTSEAMVGMSQSLGLCGNENILIAGSTHSGEEEVLVSLYKEMKERDPHFVLILAPRHLERLEEVEKVLKKESLSWQRKTSFLIKGDGADQERPGIILLDTMGELIGLYRLATVVFVGGSLVPIGGHNPLEPLLFRKCVLFGPYMFNFSEISGRLIEMGGAIQVSGKEDLFAQTKRLFMDGARRQEIGEKGYQFLRNHQGATHRMFEEIRPFLTRMENEKL